MIRLDFGLIKGNITLVILCIGVACTQPHTSLIFNPEINPCFILRNSIKTILLIKYALDNLYMIHERSANELFIKRGSCFISSLVDIICNVPGCSRSAGTLLLEQPERGDEFGN